LEENMRRIRLVSVLAIAVIVAACASSGQSSGPRRDRNRIVLEEITELAGLATALQAVQQLRPAWLTPRGRSGLPQVYRNNARWGDNPQSLADIEITSVQEMRFLSATDANTRWGTSVRGAVILVTTR
jgi:hypothetical protein